MKRLLFLLLIPLSTFGQEYIPFPLENVKWTNGYYQLNTDNPNFYFYQLSSTEVFETASDTIINEITYTKIVSNSIDYPYAGALRYAEGKVFMFLPDSVSELILYDFTLNPGDTIMIYSKLYSEFYSNLQVVEDTYYTEIDGVIRNIIQFEGGNWIEGIGTNRGLFMEVLTNVSNYWTYLECFELDGSPIFSASGADQGCLLSASNGSSNSDIVIFPNPASGEVKIQGLDRIDSYQLIDQTGRIIREENSGLNLELNFSGTATGIYVLRIQSTKGWSVHRLMLK
jgi:hypothetical protein